LRMMPEMQNIIRKKLTMSPAHLWCFRHFPCLFFVVLILITF